MRGATCDNFTAQIDQFSISTDNKLLLRNLTYVEVILEVFVVLAFRIPSRLLLPRKPASDLLPHVLLDAAEDVEGSVVAPSALLAGLVGLVAAIEAAEPDHLQLVLEDRLDVIDRLVVLQVEKVAAERLREAGEDDLNSCECGWRD